MTEPRALADLIDGRMAGPDGYMRISVLPPIWEELAAGCAAGLHDLSALWADGKGMRMALSDSARGLRTIIDLKAEDYPSVARHHAPALRLERAMRDLYGVNPIGLPDTRPWLDHGRWPGKESEQRYEFLPVEGEGLHQIPVGPVHAGIIEPGHFRFTANGETVVRLEQRLGYVHKGAESLFVGADIERGTLLIGRLSGDSTVAYAWAYAHAVEAALGWPVTPRNSVGIGRVRGLLGRLATARLEIQRVYDSMPSLQDRTVTTGIVSPALARQYAAGGFVGRAAGRAFDARKVFSYGPYDTVEFDLKTRSTGDVDARLLVRLDEIGESVRIVGQLLDRLSPGPIRGESPAPGEGEGAALVEAFRGDVFVSVRLASDGRLARVHARDASWFQWPLLEAAVEGNIVADFPLCNKSFNCSYSGADL